MGCVPMAALGCVVMLIWSCATDVCACTPAIVPALVTGRVVDDRAAPVRDAQAHAYSASAAADVLLAKGLDARHADRLM